MNSSVFGKTMENLTNYMEMQLTTDPNKAINNLSKPNLKNARYIDGVYLVEFYNDKIFYSNPIFVGCSILDWSLFTMLQLDYDVMTNIVENRYNSISSDTGSLVYNIQHDDEYEWIKTE